MDVLNLRALLTLDKSQYDRGLDEANSKSDSFGSKFGSKMGKAAKAGAVALGAFAVSSIKVGADFDKSMSQVAATMGYTVEELNTKGSEAQKTFETLESTARELGKSTKFSAQEAAEGLNYMALAGYDAQTSQRMLPQVLNLAAAGAMELGRASDIVTDAQSALGLTIQQTESMIDQMAKTASLTNTNVEQLGEAFLTVGGTAKIMKGGTVEASAALGVLASAGIKGSEGGTALRNILNSISGAKFEKSFKALGVEAYDAQGKMRALPDILTDMNNVMGDMTDQEKQDILSKTFNVRDLKSINALLAQTPDKWRELTAAIEDSKGAAANMADTQLDNLSGDVTILNSAFSELQITISDMDGGVLRTFVQGATEGINLLTDALNAGSLEEALGILGGGFNKLGDFVMKGMEGAVTAAQNKLPQLIETVMTGLSNFSGKFREGAGKFVDLGLQLIKSIADGIIKNIPTFIQTVPTIITNFAGIINDNLPKIIATGVSILKSLVVGIIKAIPVLVANIPKIIKAIVAVFTAFGWGKIGMTAIRGIAKGLRAAGSALKSAVTGPINSVKSAVSSGFTAAKNKAVQIFQSMKDGIKKKLDSIRDTIKSWISKIKGMFPFNVGKIFGGSLKLPSIKVNKKGDGSASTSSSTSTRHFAKAMSTPYVFKRPTNFMAGEAGDEVLFGRKALMNDISNAVNSNNKGKTIIMNITNNISGADDPESYMKRFVHELELQMRMA